METKLSELKRNAIYIIARVKKRGGDGTGVEEGGVCGGGGEEGNSVVWRCCRRWHGGHCLWR